MSGRTQPAAERRWHVVPASIPHKRITRGELFADVIEDRRIPGVFLCVVQREGSPEILFLGQARTLEEAETAVQEFMAEQSGRSKAGAA
jgi:hypothetical protein